MAAISLVFGQSAASVDSLDLDSFPERTSLQRNVKAFYREGKAIHETGGMILLTRQM